jgi:hypothetical protein
VIYTAIVTFIILKVLDAVMGLRVTEEEEVGRPRPGATQRTRLQPVSTRIKTCPACRAFFCPDFVIRSAERFFRQLLHVCDGFLCRQWLTSLQEY